MLLNKDVNVELKGRKLKEKKRSMFYILEFD